MRRRFRTHSAFVRVHCPDGRETGTMSPKLFSNHIVIIGWDEFARAVTEQLINANKRIFVITEDERHIEAINENYDQEQ